MNIIREILLEEFKKNPNLDCKDISVKHNISFVHTKRIILEYKKLFDVICDLWVVKSLSESNVYYLFNSFGEEKKIKIDDNEIQNDSILTEYEKLWLKINLKCC